MLTNLDAVGLIFVYSYVVFSVMTRSLATFRADDVSFPYFVGYLFGMAALAIVICANVFASLFGIETGDPAMKPRATDYLYFSMVTFSTLGYGDFRPCPDGRIFAALHGLYGMFIAPLLLAVYLRGSQSK